MDADRLSQLTAILDFHEAKLIAARGEDAKASAQLMRATQTLNRLAEQRPDSVVLRSELAACYLSSAPTHASACYRLALLWWQKGRMLGTDGKRDEEIRLTTQARELLTRLEGECQPGAPLPEQIQRSLAYLLGDLGHALHWRRRRIKPARRLLMR